MIRPFDWRDLSLLHRLRAGGLCLDAQLAYTRGPNTLQHAVLDALNPIQSACTLVARAQGGDGPDCIGQYLYRHQDSLARLTFVSPADTLNEWPGMQLLDALTRAAGSQGARHLVAEVDEHLPAFEALRRAGFAVYARQRIWRLDPPPEVGSLHAASPAPAAWRHEGAGDEIAVAMLYANLVPALVQQVEPPPHRNGRGWVHGQQSEILAYLSTDRGPLGTWVQPYLHPAVDSVDDLLQSFFSTIPRRPGRPVYIVVRSYQGWLNDILERLGLQPVCDQAVMVRRLVVPVRQPAVAAERAPAGVTIKPTAPMARIDLEPGPRPGGRTKSGLDALRATRPKNEEDASGHLVGR